MSSGLLNALCIQTKPVLQNCYTSGELASDGSEKFLPSMNFSSTSFRLYFFSFLGSLRLLSFSFVQGFSLCISVFFSLICYVYISSFITLISAVSFSLCISVYFSLVCYVYYFYSKLSTVTKFLITYFYFITYQHFFLGSFRISVFF